MRTIHELLDDCQHVCFGYGEDYIAARAAVDAEIKRMQDRIAELERQLMERNGS